jgi:hypothetical protein
MGHFDGAGHGIENGYQTGLWVVVNERLQRWQVRQQRLDTFPVSQVGWQQRQLQRIGDGAGIRLI